MKQTIIILTLLAAMAATTTAQAQSRAELTKALVETTAEESWWDINPAEVVRLLEAGAVLDSLDNYHQKATATAIARYGDTALFFKYVGDDPATLKKGLFRSDYDLLVYYTIQGGNMDILRMLLANDYRLPDFQWSAMDAVLRDMAERGDLEMARLLIAHGANLNGGGNYDSGLYPLSAAAIKGDIPMMRLFIEHGAAITRGGGTSYRDQPLYHAVIGGNLEAVCLLLDSGAGFQLESFYGRDQTIHNREIQRSVISRDIYAYNPIPDAAALGYTEIIARLVEAGYNINGWYGDRCGLTAAVDNGHCQTVKYLLDNGAVFLDNGSNEGWASALYTAAKAGSRDIAELLLERYGDNPRKNDYISGAIYNASNSGKVDMVQWLLTFSDQKPDVQQLLSGAVASGEAASVGFWLDRGGKADTLYHEPYNNYYNPQASLVETAVSRGHTEVVKTLVEHGAPFDILGIAAGYGDSEMMRFLIGKGAKPTHGDLYSASVNLKPDNVRLLLSCGLTPDGHRDRMKRTPLLGTVEYEFSEMDSDMGFLTVDSLVYETARALIDRGADVNARDYEGMTPLMFAVMGGYTPTVRLLLEKGARRDATNDFGDRVLDFVNPWASGWRADSVLLDAMGVRYTSEELDDWELWHENHPAREIKRKSQHQKDWELYEAVTRHDIEAVRTAIAAGGNPVIYDSGEEGWPVLTTALETGAPVVIYRLLVENGAPVESSNHSGTTSLMRAVMSGDADAVRFFIAQGANVNCGNEYNNTPLVFAAQNGDLAIIRLLVSHGADVNHRSNADLTPLDIANSYKHSEAAALLRSHGAKTKEELNGDE